MVDFPKTEVVDPDVVPEVAADVPEVAADDFPKTEVVDPDVVPEVTADVPEVAAVTAFSPLEYSIVFIFHLILLDLFEVKLLFINIILYFF